LIGALLRVLIQSSSTVSIIAITLAQANLLNAPQTMMIIFGSNIGSAATILLLSGNVKGTTKQIVWFHMIFDFVGGVIFLILFYAETYLHIPLVFALVNRLSNSLARQMANVYIINKIAVAVISSLFSGIACRFLTRVSPPSQEEELARLHYIHEHAMDDPDLALDLIEKEQARLFAHFPEYLHGARKDEMPENAHDYRILSKAFAAISAELTAFLGDLMKNGEIDDATSNRLLNLLDRNNLVGSIERNLFQFVETAKKAARTDSLEMMLYNFIEGMDSLQHAAVEAFESEDGSEIDLLLTITFDRGSLMEQIRKDSFVEGQSLNNQDRANLFYVISLFERGVWLLNKLGKSLRQARTEIGAADTDWSGNEDVKTPVTISSGLN
jgi:phosphate:Na+ symporter